ncbi:hypothetical protein GQ457_16G027710 [Hibiscus cannabinus]
MSNISILLSVSAAEASAIRVGIIAAIKAGYSHVVVESDNQGVINRINSKTFSAWESSSVERDISLISSRFTCISFLAISRSCNRVADWIVKTIRKGGCPDEWTRVLPPDLRKLL